jgi:mono/diheme cytochrome c family protein
LKAGNAPDSSFGGEFLHGLGYINAANLGFDDLTSAAPTGNALRDAIVTASKNYYSSIDPNNLRTNFDDFKTHNGFNTSPNVPVPNEVVAQFANTGDLGFGRDMHCLKKANGDIACYVTNYGTGYSNIAPGGGTSDQDDANNAGQRNATAEIATVAMEYSPIENDPVGDKVVKFYVYKKGLPNYGRSISANLDGRGERPVPQLCMICHGGQIPSQVGGIPAFSTAAQVKLGARFLPFDYRMYTFPTTPALPASSQDAAFKSLNETIVDFAPPGMPATDPIREVVRALYNDATHTNSPTQLLDSPVPGWQNGQSLNLNGQTNFYNKVLANACRTCHIAQPFSQLQFNTSDKFVNVANAVTANNRLMLGTAQLRVCGDYVMAHALRTHEIFWGTYTDIQASIAGISMPLEFQTFGDGVGGSTWRANLCTSFISGTVPTPPSQFYQQTIQPIWNGKCVACHVNNGAAGFLPLTEGVSYGELVPSHVVAFNDNPSTLGNILLDRITRTGAGRMPQNCVAPPTPPGPNQLPCLQQSDIDNIKAWIRNGAR